MSSDKTFQVNPDPRNAGIDVAKHVAGSLRERENEAIAKLLAITPPAFVEKLRAHLEDAHGARIYAVDDNEEAAQLLSVIYAIRDADYEATLGTRGRPKSSSTATVILLDDLQDANARPMVLRRASAIPADVIVLPSSADASLIATGLALLRESRKQAGPKVDKDLTLKITGGDSAALRAARPEGGRVLEMLRHVAPRPLAGFGTVRAVEVRLSDISPERK